MRSSGRVHRSLLLTVVVVVCLIAVSTAAEDDKAFVVDDDDDRSFSSTLFDVGRLWLRATAQQARRVVDFLLLMLSTTVAQIIFGVVLVLSLVPLYHFFFVPVDRIKLLGDVGYIRDGPQSIKDVVEQVKRRRAVGDVPPVYPNGWFALCESRSLSVGDVKNVSCLGKTTNLLR